MVGRGNERGQAAAGESTPTRPSWIRPGFAVVVVGMVAVVVVGIVLIALFELAAFTSDDGSSAADPNAATIIAIASSGITAVSTLAAAYFGIKVASEQTAQANETAAKAVDALALRDSTSNGNPPLSAFDDTSSTGRSNRPEAT